MSPGTSGRPARNGWSQLGIVLAVLVAVFGLVLLGVIILAVAAMSSFGSNK